VSLEGAVPAEPVDYTVGAIVRSCITRRRDVPTSRATAVGIFVGRHAPSLLDALVSRRFERIFAGRERPAFLRSFEGETPEKLAAQPPAPEP